MKISRVELCNARQGGQVVLRWNAGSVSAFERADRGMVFVTASEVAASTDRYDAIVAAMVERLRGAGVVRRLAAA